MIFMFRNSLVPVVLTAFSLAALPAHAQTLTLNNGDSLTVSGTGTVGTQNGMPVANTTSFYTGVQTNGTSTFTLLPGGTINAGGNDPLDAEGSGAVTIDGGTLSAGSGGTDLFDNGSGAITVNAGTFSAGLDRLGSGGTGLDDAGSGAVTVNGGTFSVGDSGTGLFDSGSGTLVITGGTFSAGPTGEALFAESSGLVTISGGTFSGGQDGTGTGLDIEGASTLNLMSLNDTPFLINGIAMNNTTLSSSLYLSGTDTISGTLANGDILNTTFYDAATLNLNVPVAPVPEASTTVSFGLLLALGMGGIVVAARKKKAAVSA